MYKVTFPNGAEDTRISTRPYAAACCIVYPNGSGFVARFSKSRALAEKHGRTWNDFCARKGAEVVVVDLDDGEAMIPSKTPKIAVKHPHMGRIAVREGDSIVWRWLHRSEHLHHLGGVVAYGPILSRSTVMYQSAADVARLSASVLESAPDLKPTLRAYYEALNQIAS